MSDQQLTFERDGEIVVLTMNNPRRKNALTPEMIALMSQAWDEIDADDCIRVAILTGYGDSYCVGGDLADGWMVKRRQGQEKPPRPMAMHPRRPRRRRNRVEPSSPTAYS